jgi:hypothetical protein
MGTASSTGSQVASAGSGLGDSASGAVGSVTDTAQGAMGTVQSRTQGNPLAAGMIAFGAGMLISALIPASDKEAQAAQRVVETAKDQGLVDEVSSVGQEMGQNLKQAATEAAEEVKSTAQDSAQTVAQGQSSAQTVRDQSTPS